MRTNLHGHTLRPQLWRSPRGSVPPKVHHERLLNAMKYYFTLFAQAMLLNLSFRDCITRLRIRPQDLRSVAAVTVAASSGIFTTSMYSWMRRPLATSHQSFHVP